VPSTPSVSWPRRRQVAQQPRTPRLLRQDLNGMAVGCVRLHSLRDRSRELSHTPEATSRAAMEGRLLARVSCECQRAYYSTARGGGGRGDIFLNLHGMPKGHGQTLPLFRVGARSRRVEWRANA